MRYSRTVGCLESPSPNKCATLFRGPSNYMWSRINITCMVQSHAHARNWTPCAYLEGQWYSVTCFGRKCKTVVAKGDLYNHWDLNIIIHCHKHSVLNYYLGLRKIVTCLFNNFMDLFTYIKQIMCSIFHVYVWNFLIMFFSYWLFIFIHPHVLLHVRKDKRTSTIFSSNTPPAMYLYDPCILFSWHFYVKIA